MDRFGPMREDMNPDKRSVVAKPRDRIKIRLPDPAWLSPSSFSMMGRTGGTSVSDEKLRYQTLQKMSRRNIFKVPAYAWNLKGTGFRNCLTYIIYYI